MAGINADQFGQWEDNAKKLVSVADAVGGFGRQAIQPALDWHAQQEAERKLEKRLGEWAKEAKRGGQWHHPMLRLESFETHRDSNDGYFTPVGECTSNFGWAHLLYALNIRPDSLLPSGQKIIEWKLPVGDTNLVETEGIHLEMPAEVLWHIINLYRMYSEPDLRNSNNSTQTNPRYRLPFGTLSVELFDELVVAKFDSSIPTTNVGKAITNVPFRIQQYSPGGGDRLRFPKEQVINAYLIAIASGISRPELGFSGFEYPADRARELVERTKELVGRLKALRSSPWADPYLLTGGWLGEAARVYRRISTDTGEYLDLPNDIISAMKTKPLIIQFIKDLFGKDDGWEETAKGILRSRQLLPGQQIQLVWAAQTSLPTKATLLSQIIDQELPSILNSFSEKPKGSLVHTLSRVQDEAGYLLAGPSAGPQIRNTPGVVLEFTPEHKLWGCDCIIN